MSNTDIYVFSAVMFSALIAVLVWCYKPKRKLRLSPRRMTQFLDSIDDLHETAEKYRKVENMIIELNNINHNHLRGVTVDIPKFTNSEIESYNFICSGGFKTNNFKKILEQERLRLLEELAEKTYQLDKKNATDSILKRWGDYRDED